MKEITTKDNSSEEVKKEYEKPEIQVFELEGASMLLQLSDLRRYQKDFD